MRDHSQDEQALMKIQHEWAEARIKGDSSYARRIEAEDCTIVWSDGRIVNKRGDLESMTGDIVFSEFKRGQSPQRKIRLDLHICETGRSMEGGRFANHSGLGKMIAHGYR